MYKIILNPIDSPRFKKVEPGSIDLNQYNLFVTDSGFVVCEEKKHKFSKTHYLNQFLQNLTNTDHVFKNEVMVLGYDSGLAVTLNDAELQDFSKMYFYNIAYRGFPKDVFLTIRTNGEMCIDFHGTGYSRSDLQLKFQDFKLQRKSFDYMGRVCFIYWDDENGEPENPACDFLRKCGFISDSDVICGDVTFSGVFYNRLNELHADVASSILLEYLHYVDAEPYENIEDEFEVSDAEIMELLESYSSEN